MSKKQNKNKRAFTLTELLIVVIVIGVLSAVTLPKFTRVIENRKVTEAEEMMSAVRTEQERRCAMDKPYTLKFDNLSDVVSSSNTKNYTYSLQNEGISAKSNKGDYTLKMLSYQDGSFCCEGDDCTKLNKNYPSCDGLTFPSSGCEGTDGDGSEIGTDPTPSVSCTDGQVRGSQSCNTCGVQTTQACVGGRWVSQLGECSKTAAECETPKPECTEGAVSGSQSCNGCGTQTTKKCVSGKWTSFLGACSKTEQECWECSEVGLQQYEPCNGCGQRVVKECNSSHRWQNVKNAPCSKTEAECKKTSCTPSATYQIVDYNQAKNIYGAANGSFCDSSWENRTSKYKCPTNLTKPKSCIDMYLYKKGGTKAVYEAKQQIISTSNENSGACGCRISFDAVNESWKTPINGWIDIGRTDWNTPSGTCAKLAGKSEGAYGLWHCDINVSSYGGVQTCTAKATVYGICRVKNSSTYAYSSVTCCPPEGN